MSGFMLAVLLCVCVSPLKDSGARSVIEDENLVETLIKGCFKTLYEIFQT